MIKAVIFDFDEVIIRSAENHLNAFLQTLERIGYKVNKNEVIKRFGKTAKDITRDLFPNWKEKEINSFLVKKEKTYREIIEKKGIRKVRGVKGLLDFLTKRKIKLAICSASSRKNLLVGLEKTNLKRYFKIIVSAEDVKRHKPNPDPLLRTAKLLKENPKNCVYIGDSIYEMQAAKRAKMIAIGLVTGFYSEKELKENGADYVCRNFREVKNLIKRFLKIA